MNITEFTALMAEKLQAYLRGELQKEVRVKPEKIMKLNDQSLHGLSIMKGDDPAPTYYLEGMFHAYEQGASPEALVKDLAEAYMEIRKHGPVPAEVLPDMELRSIRRKVGLRLVGRDYNREYLKTVPFRDVGNGYALICDVQINASDGGLFSTIVTNEMAKTYKYDMDRLFEQALENAWRSNAASLRSMQKLILDGETGEEDDTCYVLTTDRERFGAAALFYPGTQAMIEHVLGEDYIAIPSSLHEFIILRASRVPDLQRIIQLVKEANSTFVGRSEVLSDNVLLYSKSTRELSLVPDIEDLAFEMADLPQEGIVSQAGACGIQ